MSYDLIIRLEAGLTGRARGHPGGEYELWTVNDEGGFWFVSNALGRRTGEPVSGQSLRFRVIHAGGVDAGTGSP